MATKGMVESWYGAHGFAKTQDGIVAYIKDAEIGMGSLVVGQPVYFDYEEVQGHNGRVRAYNVSGPGVSSERKGKGPAKGGKGAPGKGAPVKGGSAKGTKGGKNGPNAGTKGSNAQTPLGIAPRSGGFKGVAGTPVGGLGAMAGRGSSLQTPQAKGAKGARATIPARAPRIAGSPTTSSPMGGKGKGKGQRDIIPARAPQLTHPTPVQQPVQAAPERRVDPADGNQYTMEEFRACYGGTNEWHAAAPKPKPPPPAAGRGAELRIDPADNATYTKADFFACYGGYKEWDRAQPYIPGGRGRGSRH